MWPDCPLLPYIWSDNTTDAINVTWPPGCCHTWIWLPCCCQTCHLGKYYFYHTPASPLRCWHAFFYLKTQLWLYIPKYLDVAIFEIWILTGYHTYDLNTQLLPFMWSVYLPYTWLTTQMLPAFFFLRTQLLPYLRSEYSTFTKHVIWIHNCYNTFDLNTLTFAIQAIWIPNCFYTCDLYTKMSPNMWPEYPFFTLHEIWKPKCCRTRCSEYPAVAIRDLKT